MQGTSKVPVLCVYSVSYLVSFFGAIRENGDMITISVFQCSVFIFEGTRVCFILSIFTHFQDDQGFLLGTWWLFWWFDFFDYLSGIPAFLVRVLTHLENGGVTCLFPLKGLRVFPRNNVLCDGFLFSAFSLIAYCRDNFFHLRFKGGTLASTCRLTVGDVLNFFFFFFVF